MIKVKLKPEQGIKVKLTPSQNHEVNLKTVYLYDPDWIPEIGKAVSDAKESAEKAKESEINAAESASNADADATNASESATIAYNSEQNAIAQANKATEEANAAAESAHQAQTSALAAYEYASNAEADAQNALETLGHVLEVETNATNAATTATEQAGVATEKATEAGTHATNAGVSAANAKTSEDNAKNYELGAKGYSETATQEANASAESAYQSQQSALASAQYASDAESDAQNALETLGHVLESETISTNAANTATQKAQEASESAEDAQESAEEAQRIKDSLGNVYVFKGSVATFEDLPTNASVGDVYDVLDTGKNYAWDGSRWDDIGGTVDLSAYAKTTYVDAREQAVRADYAQADSELQTQINGQATAITEAQGDIVEIKNNYTTKEYVDTTEQEIIENFMEADTSLQTQITGLSNALATEQGKITSIEGKIPTNASTSNLLSTASDLLNATQDVRADFAEADSELQTQITGQATVLAEIQDDVMANMTEIADLKTSKQDKLTAGENITIENNVISSTGGGTVINLDNISITKNTDDNIQTIGVIDQNNTSKAIKTWTGTKEEFDALVKDENTLYNVNDEAEYDIKVPVLEALYPIGSIYIGTQDICPLTILIPNSQWELVANDRVLQGSGSRNAGNTVEAGLPNITGGVISGGVYSTYNATGAFTGSYNNGGDGATHYVSANSQVQHTIFDASRSSSIYGNSNTVQPPAFIVNIWKRIA